MKKRLLLTAITLSLAVLYLAFPAIAQEKPLKMDEIVVTGTRSQEQIKYLPVPQTIRQN